jgi:hypothetical protein
MINKFGLQRVFTLSLSLIALLLMISCEEIGNETIEQSTFAYHIVGINAPTNFFYSAADSLLLTSIQFQDSEYIDKVWVSIKSLDGKVIITSRSELFDDGNIQKNGDTKAKDNIFSGKIGVSKKYSSGKYYVEFFLEDKIRKSPENITKVASHIFNYNNNQIQYSPVISNLSIPNTVNREQSFVFTIKVEDQNGLSDVSQVYFKLYRPDGTLVDPQNGLGYFLMVDDGNLNVYGDQIAGDGIYSFKNSFSVTAQLGKWKFEFQAIDRSNRTSNIIIHELIVN